jgi:hypothetical protein
LEYTMEAADSPAYRDRYDAALATASVRDRAAAVVAVEEAAALAASMSADELLLVEETISMSSSIDARRADDEG